MKKTLSILAVLPLLCAFGSPEGATYHIGHAPKFVNIAFESETEVETILGITNQAKGQVTFYDEVPPGKPLAQVSITVPTASLKTGIEERDEHLQSDQWLDAAKYPEIRFVSKKVSPVEGKKDLYQVVGDFTMHGTTREIIVSVTLKEISAEALKKAPYIPEGRWLKFITQFQVRLSEFGVKIPDMAVPYVNDTWTVKMSIFAGTPKPEEPKEKK